MATIVHELTRLIRGWLIFIEPSRGHATRPSEWQLMMDILFRSEETDFGIRGSLEEELFTACSWVLPPLALTRKSQEKKTLLLSWKANKVIWSSCAKEAGYGETEKAENAFYIKCGQPDNGANFSHKVILCGGSRSLFWGYLVISFTLRKNLKAGEHKRND